MANHAYAGATSRPHWGGAASDIDIHLEIYQNEVDTVFRYNSVFQAWSAQRSVADRSNTYRIDRLNSTTVKGRRSGEALDATKVANDKVLFVVDTTLYIRNPIDYQDDWTAPDWLGEMGRNNGSSFAELHDQAHVITLQKARTWTAPAHLVPAFSDGIDIDCTFKAAAATEAEVRANAISLVDAHKKAVKTLIRRKIPLNNMVTIVDPDVFETLLEHPKLLNKDFVDSNGDYAGRRVVMVNGIPIVELICFPQAVITDHPLGAAFNVAADDVRAKMIVFDKQQSLITVEAKSFTTRIWDDQKEFCNVLDAYAMYTVGSRRPDTVAVISLVEPV